MSDFIHFWIRCFSGGFEFAITELAYLDGTCIVIGTILLLRRNKAHRRVWERNLEGLVRKFCGILILGQLILCVFLVAPYIQFHDEQVKSQNAKTKNADFPSYTANSNILTESALVLGNGNTVDNSKKYFGDTNKPSFQLFISCLTETNGLTPTMLGLSMGQIIYLKKVEDKPQPAEDISLSVVVYGDSPADHLVVELYTPWVGQLNITGDSGWQEKGMVDFLDPTTRTFNNAHFMAFEMEKPIPPNQLTPLPNLHVPTNYPASYFQADGLQVRFRIYSFNGKVKEIGVIFKLE